MRWLIFGVLLSVSAISVGIWRTEGVAAQSRPRRVGAAVTQTKPTPPAVPTPVAPVPTPPAEAAVSVGEDDEIERVETNLTNVLLTALDNNREFVTSLAVSDLRVYENDTLQPNFTLQKETDLPLSVAVVIDTSVSQENTLPAEKSAALTFARNILRPDRDRAAVVAFSGVPEVRQALTADIPALQSALESVTISRPLVDYQNSGVDDPGCKVDPRGCSAIWDTLADTTRRILATTPENTRRAIILLSDGQDSSSEIKREAAAEEAIKNNTVIYAIGIGDRDRYKVEESTLRKLTERTGGRAYFPRRPDDVAAAFAQIGAELRAQYLLSYTPTNTARDGSYRRIRVELKNRRNLRLFYRNGYYARR